MKRFFCLYSYILVLVFSNFLQIPVSVALVSNKKTDTKEISTDFLNNVPNSFYILGPGDALRVNISRELPELASVVQVSGEGTVTLPRLKKIYVNELTVNELTELLNKVYKKYVKNPDVEIEILNYRPIRVLLEGEVTNPGVQVLQGFVTISPTSEDLSLTNKYLLEKENRQQIDSLIQKFDTQYTISERNYNSINYFFPTVFDAIRQAGGITEYSDLSSIQIIRKNSISNGEGKISAKLDFSQVLTFGNDSQNIRIYDSDIIRVGKLNQPNELQLNQGILSNLNPKFIKVFVAGRVLNPGVVTLSRTGVMTDAVMLAGGTKVLKGPLTFVRNNSDGSIDKRRFSYKSGAKRGSYKNPKLKDGDVILVGESLLSMSTEVIEEFTAPFFGLYSTYGLIKAINSD